MINFTKDYYTYITVEEGSATTLYMYIILINIYWSH